MTSIARLLEGHVSPGEKVTVKGWIRTVRNQKNFSFIEVNDGSSLANLQVVITENTADYDEIREKAATGAGVIVSGETVTAPSERQKIEIHAASVTVIGTCDSDYPLQKKRHGFEFLRTIAHLRPRTNTIGAVMRVRNALAFSSHRFFQEQEFLLVHTPIISVSDCEGAGELFRVTTLREGETDFEKDFFGKPSFLTVSGQLNAEAYALAFSKVYTFGPTFRAENSHTSRHLAEFWMLEPEMAFRDLSDAALLAESYLKYVLKDLLEKQANDLAFFEKFISPGLIDTLQFVVEKPFERITYTEAVDILTKAPRKFEFPVAWGLDLQSEHERYLAEEHFQKPTIVTDYPREMKAFYMRDNDDGRTCAAMDVLVPGIGELIGGAQREDRYDVLRKKMIAKGLDPAVYGWYLDLRKYGGVPHAGFGLGFERLVQYATGMENIRDVIPFPRAPRQADF